MLKFYCVQKKNAANTVEQNIKGDFPGGPVVKTSPSNEGSEGLIPDRRAKIPHASQPKDQKHKTKAIL